MKEPRNERQEHAEMLRGLGARPELEAATPARTVNALMVVAVLLVGIAAVFLKWGT